MNPKQTQEGYDGIYLERSGKSALGLTEILIAQPEFPLDEAQKEEAYEFEKLIIASHELEPNTTVDGIIRAHKGETTTAPYFFSEAFLNNKVDVSDLTEPIPSFSSSQDVYTWLATVASSSEINEKTLTKMAKDSANYYKQTVADLLLSGGLPEPSTMDHMSIVLNPSEMIKKSQLMVQARQYLHALHGQYKEGGDKLDGAKRALADIYLAKVNGMVVGDMITLEYLVNQSKLIGDIETEQAASNIVPAVVDQAFNSDRLKTVKQLDYLRNGRGRDESGLSSVVDSAVVEDANSEKLETQFEKPLFSSEDCEKLKAFKLSPNQMVGLYSSILQKAGLLSSEDSSTWDPKRSHRAADGLFQVVINPVANNFSISGRSGVYKVSSEARSLFDVIVIGGFHELEHVNQVQVDLELGKKLNIADLKGKRTTMFRESGANAKQREAETLLFGERKPIALAYAKALQTLEDGGNAFDATLAFYNEKRIAMPNLGALVVAKEASDRVLRLTRHGGINSESMSYAEEKILDKELRNAPADIKERASVVSSLDLVDQVRLHKYDLLPMPEKPSVDWTDIIIKEVEPYILEALSNS